MDINSILIVGGIIFLIMFSMVVVFAFLFWREREKNENKYREDVLKKLEAIGLTERQKEIQTKVMEGKTSQEIADELFIDKSTVDTHRKNINVKFKKANIHKQYVINL
jgi:DNA-binding CsgD family transcriptional regulator